MKEALRRAIAIRDGINRKTGVNDKTITDGVNKLTYDKTIILPKLQIVENPKDIDVAFDDDPFKFVEWLQTTDGGYFDTNVLTSNDIAFEVKFRASNTDKFIFGARYDSSSDGFGMNTTDRPYIMYGGASIQIVDNINIRDGNDHIVYLSNSDFTIDGISYNITRGTASRFFNIYVFGMNQNNSLESRKFDGLLYYLKIWKAINLIRDYRPAINKYNNSPHLIDLVTKEVLYKSAGTFTRGPVISGGD